MGPATAGVAVGNQRADTDNRMVDVLRELVAHRRANSLGGLADVTVGSVEPSYSAATNLWLRLAEALRCLSYLLTCPVNLISCAAERSGATGQGESPHAI